MAKVKSDQQGLFVITGCFVARPLKVVKHALPLPHYMTHGGLKSGDMVTTVNMADFTLITCQNGTQLKWPHDVEASQAIIKKNAANRAVKRAKYLAKLNQLTDHPSKIKQSNSNKFF